MSIAIEKLGCIGPKSTTFSKCPYDPSAAWLAAGRRGRAIEGATGTAERWISRAMSLEGMDNRGVWPAIDGQCTACSISSLTPSQHDHSQSPSNAVESA